jgi:2-polyprenyl-6-methoxyphenol hydroxylase-like FAD-dependent oxidoreductase
MTEHAVVIAGGSPTGLMLAGELALARVDVAIVERRPNQDLAGARASRFSTKLSMQRTYYARVGALLPQSGVHGRPFARGR